MAKGCVDEALAMLPPADGEKMKAAVGLLERACDEAEDARACGYVATFYAESAQGGPPADPVRMQVVIERACRGQDARGRAVAVALADAYLGGKLGEADPVRALPFYREACTGGDGRACVSAGVMMGDGGVEALHDVERAFAHFQAACKLEVADGCAGVAIGLASGRGALKDEVAARKLAASSCEAGASDGCSLLGVLTDRGVGGPADPRAAFAAFERACTTGNSSMRATACARVAHAHLTGRGVIADKKKSGPLFDRACKAAAPDAPAEEPRLGCVVLAVMAEAGYGVLVPKDDALATALYDHLCDTAGSGAGCAARGAFRERLGKTAQAKADYQRACKRGITDACARAR